MSEVAQRNEEEATQIAANENLIAFFPQDNELFLDLDAGMDVNNIIYIKLSDHFPPVISELVTISKGGNKHMYLRMDFSGDELTLFGFIPINKEAKIALQALLGSDPVKELLSLARVRIGSTAPIALFETDTEAKRVEEWRRR